MEDKFKNYSYYKGEDKCPFDDTGRCFWWRLESEAVSNSDKKNPGELSSTMWSYLRNKMWQGDGQWNTSEKEFMERAKRLYNSGLWSRSFITRHDFPFDRVLDESR